MQEEGLTCRDCGRLIRAWSPVHRWLGNESARRRHMPGIQSQSRPTKAMRMIVGIAIAGSSTLLLPR
jgi:hypothetical protein